VHGLDEARGGLTERRRNNRESRYSLGPPMALKKSELYSTLWSSCGALRGGMDASQYKDYVLVLLFCAATTVYDPTCGSPRPAR
jgi:hypothetical protein